MLKTEKLSSDFYRLLNTIKLNINKNKEFIFYKTIKNHKFLLSFLQKEGYILSYTILNGFVYIKLKTNKFSNKDYNFNNFLTLKKSFKIKQKNKSISFKNLINLQKKEGNISNYLLNTDFGILTSQEAINKRIGGKIILKFT